MSLQAFRETRAEAKRQAVLTAATELFAEHGLSNVSMATLADKAGVSTATLYRHFADKEDVFASVVDQLVNNVIARSAQDAMNANDSLLDLCHRYAALLTDPTVVGCLRAVAADKSGAFMDRLQEHGNAIFINEFEHAIRAARRAAGLPAEDSVTQASMALRGTIEHFTIIRALLFHSIPDPEEVNRLTTRTFDAWRERWLT